MSGPKRPHDRVALKDLAAEFREGLTQPVSFKAFGLKPEQASKKVLSIFYWFAKINILSIFYLS